MESLDKQRKDSRQFAKHAMEIAMLLGKRMNEKGWSKTEVSEMVGVNASEVSKWLAGTQNFTIRTIAKIENALDIEIVRYFSDDELGLLDDEIELTNTSEKSVSVEHSTYKFDGDLQWNVYVSEQSESEGNKGGEEYTHVAELEYGGF